MNCGVKAHPGSWTSKVQGDDWYCLPCDKWCQNPRSKSHTCWNHTNFQESFNTAQEETECKYHCFKLSPSSNISCRVILSAEPSILHVMRGKPAIRMDTLLSLGIGLKKTIQDNGSARPHCSDLQRWIMLTMVSASAVPYSRFSIVSALHTRFV